MKTDPIKKRLVDLGAGLPWFHTGRGAVKDSKGVLVAAFASNEQAEFIAHAATDITDMLDEVERLRALLNLAIEEHKWPTNALEKGLMVSELENRKIRLPDGQSERANLAEWPIWVRLYSECNGASFRIRVYRVSDNAPLVVGSGNDTDNAENDAFRKFKVWLSENRHNPEGETRIK